MFGFESLGSSMEGIGRSLYEGLKEVDFNEIIPTSDILDPGYENSVLGRRALEAPIVDTFETTRLTGTSPFGSALDSPELYQQAHPENTVKETITDSLEETKKSRTVDKEALKERVTQKHEYTARRKKSALNPEYDLEGLKKEVSEVKPSKARKAKKSSIKKAADKKQTKQLRKPAAEALENVKKASTGNISVNVNDHKSITLDRMADYYNTQARNAQEALKRKALENANKSSTGKISVRVNDAKSPELAKMADYYRAQEALANVKKASTGNISVNVTNRKSPELTKMADFYRKQAAKADKAQAKIKEQALTKVKNAFSQKPEFSPEAIEQRVVNGATKKNVWAMEDMKKYYQELEASSNKGIIGFLKKNKKTAIIATAALAVIGLSAYIMHKNSSKANKTA